jgi:uncharacterized protein YecE (DUF72 family)
MTFALTRYARERMRYDVVDMTAELRVGTAGWTLPAGVRASFGNEGSHLERYARRFSCVEINSSFYREHRAGTYARWASAVPADFRFALKIPKEITHTKRLVDAGLDLARFIDASSALGDKRDVLLVQLPPSFVYDAPLVADFFTRLRGVYDGRVACEPRHASWFTGDADTALAESRVARVAADPAPNGAPFAPGGWPGFQYWRLHGSPHTYYSSYETERLDDIVATLESCGAPVWCIFDNTALGAATGNALDVVSRAAVPTFRL